MLEPEVVEAVGGGLVGAVEDDQVAVVVLVYAADREVEPSWTDGGGEPSRDGPAETCGSCGRVFNVYTAPPGSPPRCDRCDDRPELVQRPDDNAATVARRLEVYAAQTHPLVEHYRRQGLLHTINAARAAEAVTAQLVALLETLGGTAELPALARRKRPARKAATRRKATRRKAAVGRAAVGKGAARKTARARKRPVAKPAARKASGRRKVARKPARKPARKTPAAARRKSAVRRRRRS